MDTAKIVASSVSTVLCCEIARLITTTESCISLNNYILLGSPNSYFLTTNNSIKLFNNDVLIACNLLRRHFWAGKIEFVVSANYSPRFSSRGGSELVTDKSHPSLANRATLLAGKFEFDASSQSHGWGLSVIGLALSHDLNRGH
jgi:hypothetical protein